MREQGGKDGRIDVYRISGVAVENFNISAEDQATQLADAMFEHNESRRTLSIVVLCVALCGHPVLSQLKVQQRPLQPVASA